MVARIAAGGRNPTTGIAGCCARASSGHAAAGAPPSSVMNSHLLIRSPRRRTLRETTRKSGTEYTNPTTGQPVYKTMTFFIQMLRPGEKLLPIRQNSSLICTVFQGRGNSMIGDKTFDWEPFDTFCVPGGQWLEHTNISATEDAIILISSDEPTLSKLGFALKHGRDRNGDTVVLESSTRSEV
jgi:hypothetical protein